MSSAVPERARAPRSFDPFSETFSRDPYSAYAEVRDRAGLVYYEPFDMWLVARHADVTRVLRSPHMVRTLDETQLSAAELQERQRRDNWHDMPCHSRFVQFSMLDSDGEVHDRLREMVMRHFTPKALAWLRPETQRFVDGLLDQVIGREEIDFVEDFAAQVPGRVIGTLIGVPSADCAQLRRWSEDIVQFFDIDRSDERKLLAEETTERFYRYLLDLAAERRRNARDDLMSELVGLYDRDELDEDEFISTCMLIVMAGHGSTVDVLSSGVHCLLRFDQQMQRLRSEPDLLSSGVEEIFRFEPPLPFFHRYTTREVQFGHQLLPSGTRFGLLYGSANRDERVFEQPDRFDVARRPNRHKAFGGGAHFCLGIHLARLTVQLVLAALLDRCREIELLAEPEYKRGLAVRGPRMLRLRLTPR